MADTLKGAVALVTGASSGIGEASALRLAHLGASVALVARRKDRLEALAAKVAKAGGNALVIEADVTEQSAVNAAVEWTVSEFGGLDIVLANAGVMLLGPIEHAPVEEWDRMIHLNVLGLMYAAKAAIPHLLEAAKQSPRGVADLVNVSSVAGRVARAGSGVYNASKFGVGAFAESMRQEFTARQLRVGLIEPGAVETELTDHLRDEVRKDVAKRFAGFDRLQADDIADALEFMVTRPKHVAINEILVRPTGQEG